MSDHEFASVNDLLARVERLKKFNMKHGVYPVQEAASVAEELYTVAESISVPEVPETKGEVLRREAKRKLASEAVSLQHMLSGANHDFETVVDMHTIPREDIHGLRGWLETNKESTIEAIDRLFQDRPVESYALHLQTDVPSIRRQAEGFAEVHIERYHANIGMLLQELTQVGDFLREIRAVPTTEARSYFHPLTKMLAISIPAICSTTEQGSLELRERELIAIYGHEGMGHALNQVITESNGLPFFLRVPSSFTSAAAESVAQFYQQVMFNDLRASPETQRALGLEDTFEAIYQEAQDTRLIGDYKLKLFQYAITVMGDKRLGGFDDPAALRAKVERIAEIAIDPSYPMAVVQENRYSFDSEGNLSPQLVSELRYCAQPVSRALAAFEAQGISYGGSGRSKIDDTLLRGFWTPIGLVENATLAARDI